MAENERADGTVYVGTNARAASNQQAAGRHEAGAPATRAISAADYPLTAKEAQRLTGFVRRLRRQYAAVSSMQYVVEALDFVEELAQGAWREAIKYGGGQERKRERERLQANKKAAAVVEKVKARKAQAPTKANRKKREEAGR